MYELKNSQIFAESLFNRMHTLDSWMMLLHDASMQTTYLAIQLIICVCKDKV